MNHKTLIIGATGQVGSELARLLKKEGQSVALASSRIHQDADYVQLNLLTGDGLEAAFESVDKAFLLAPPGYSNQHELLAPLIEQARQKGLKKLVLMTAMGVNADESIPFRKAEIQLEQSGVPYNIIRPNWFMQNFNSFWSQGIVNDQKIYLPTGQAKGAFIDSRDIAAVAATLLQSDAWNNQAFDLTGAEALNHDEVAAILSEVTGKDITYEEVSPGVMREQLLVAGLPEDYTEFLLMILDAFKQGFSARITDSVQQVLGRDPIRFKAYAEQYKNVW